MTITGEQLESIVREILKSKKYASLAAGFIAYHVRAEAPKRKKVKDIIQNTKRKLHQVTGCFSPSHRYEQWEADLASVAGGWQAAKPVCLEIMAQHVSTNERLPVLDTFYRTLFAGLPEIRSLGDFGCGLHPLALPWMPLPENIRYHAYDINTELIAFLNRYFQILQVQGQAEVLNILSQPVTQATDIAFLFKILPILEQESGLDILRFLDKINARYLVVSFPVRSIGGKNKGMVKNYSSRFLQVLEKNKFEYKRFDFQTELVFRLKKT